MNNIRPKSSLQTVCCAMSCKVHQFIHNIGLRQQFKNLVETPEKLKIPNAKFEAGEMY
jgi:hypothetical protein